MNKYNHKAIEKKWKNAWTKSKIFKTLEPAASAKASASRGKFYVLDMFPYPSGAGLHVGHPKGYIATDIVARMKMMQGYNVLHPMGWDAFGLPAENYAIKNKVHPATATAKNIKTFKKQLGLLGFTYDWDREVTTTDPKYYKWTQWAFIQMFKHGLAYESYEPINWCPDCKTSLANEDLEGGLCERCGSVVEQKPMRQWVLRITKYADRLLNDLEKLEAWPKSIKTMQKDWIGRSEGAEVQFIVIPTEAEGRAEESLRQQTIRDSSASLRFAQNDKLIVFTTRPDTLFGATYLVVAPEHEIVKKLKDKITNWSEVEKYLATAKQKTALERTELQKEKTGVELKGIKAINPVNDEELPIFIADYVLANYGTGAIMAVPAHDERDWEFAKKYGLTIKSVVAAKFVEVVNPPRTGKKFKRRKTIHVILKRPSDNKILMLQWKGEVWGDRKPRTFIIGGIEADEDPILAAKREVREEIGYKNLKFIKDLGIEVHTEYFAAHKDENRQADIRVLYFELENEEKDSVTAEEMLKHEPVWIEESEAGKFVNVSDGPFIWDWFLSGGRAFTGDGVAINSDFLNDLPTAEAKTKMIAWLEEKNIGQKKVQYKLRDWVFSRQRYWGEPIPLIHCEKDGWVPVPEKDLPLKLPNVKKYEPSGTGESPLATIDKWVNTKCPVCKGPAKRETNTMPQWAGSCWYYLAYTMLGNQKSKIKNQKYEWNQAGIDYWNPVDLYVGGAEHATRHLIYARFWHKFLYDIGMVKNDEPFTRLQNVGLILAEDGRKMSKRWGNVINPDDIVEEFGADAMRLYEMFMGPFDQTCAWSTNGLIGTRRFLERVWTLAEKIKNQKSKIKITNQNAKINTVLHQTIKKVSDDIEAMRYNTAIAHMMTLVNEMIKAADAGSLLVTPYSLFIQLLAPFAPHVAEEIWEALGNKNSIFKSTWPVYDPALAIVSEVTIAIQVNGKLRDAIVMDAEVSEDEAKKFALASEKVQKWLEGKTPKKVIYIKGKLISIVV